MCGISGIIGNDPDLSLLEKMNNSLSHRGPEAGTLWINANQTAGLGHRRLSIIDRSNDSHQPMHYLDRYTIIHNGEVYNYIECRDQLVKKGYQFRTVTDTEVILAAYDCYGAKCLSLFDGMFAFAIWDEARQELFFARDRFGEKPFFYAYDKGENLFRFASELKSLRIPNSNNVDNELLLLYLALGHTSLVTQPSSTFYTDISQLPPAHFGTYASRENIVKITRYWSCQKLETEIREDEAISQFDKLLTLSISRRLRSDVEVGASLSGGLDSSSIVARMAGISGKQNNCFSAVFPGYEKDESKYIDQVTDKYRLTSHKIEPRIQDFLEDLPAFIKTHEEPVSSPSVYAQYKVFELAKEQGVTVLLDGQGADEILAGYSRYFHWHLQALFAKGKFQEAFNEKSALKQNDQRIEWTYKNILAAFAPKKAALFLQEREKQNLQRNPDLSKKFIEHNYNPALFYKPEVNNLNDILYFTTFEFGLQELLRYADRNSMAHSREVRLPFLSHELVEFIFTLPAHFKIRQGWTKWILRKTIAGELPDAITWRKTKIGFEVPDDLWMHSEHIRPLVKAAKMKLADLKILNTDTSTKNNRPMNSSLADWRYLIAAQLL